MRQAEFRKAMAVEVPRPYEVEEDRTTMMLRRIFWNAIDDELPLDLNGQVSQGNDIFTPFKEIYVQLGSSFEKGDPTLAKITSFYHDFILKMVFVLQTAPVEVESTHVEPLRHHSDVPTTVTTDDVSAGAAAAINSESA